MQLIFVRLLRNDIAIHHWETGQEWEAIAVSDGILLKPKSPFPETRLSQVAVIITLRQDI